MIASLWRQLVVAPLLFGELLLASLFINLLALASSIYVMLVLQRYVAFQVDATLFTLTAGALIAILFEFLLRNARLRLAGNIGRKRLNEKAEGLFGLLATSDFDALQQQERPGLHKALGQIEAANAPGNVTPLFDAMFAVIFIVGLYLLHPLLAAIAVGFILLAVGVTLLGQRMAQRRNQAHQQLAGRKSDQLGRMLEAGEAARLFDPQMGMLAQWRELFPQWRKMKARISLAQGRMQSLTGMLQAVLATSVIFVGAILVKGGALDVGMLIGANIMAARALAPFVALARLGQVFAEARDASRRLRELARLPGEARGKTAPEKIEGRLELQDVAFSFADGAGPLFEKLDLTLHPGQTLLVKGENGAGKTSFARLICGLLQPDRGQILLDGVNIAQLPPRWHRNQLSYLPQDPTFIGGSIGQNLLLARPGLSEPEMQKLCARAGLEAFIKADPEGLDHHVGAKGEQLSFGLRRRIALARALAVNGQLVVFDEPTEGLDEKGRQAVYALMNAMAGEKRTIIVSSDDPNIIKGAHFVLDLDQKPQPRVEKAGQKKQVRIVSRSKIPETSKVLQ